MLWCILGASLFYVQEPVVNMREAPMGGSKVVSQAVFSENVQVDKEEGNWTYIITPDQYSGWVPVSSLTAVPEEYKGDITVSRLAAHIYGIKDTEFGPVKTVPYGAKLISLDASDPRWIQVALPDGQSCYIQKGDVALGSKMGSKKELVLFSQKFLGLPYTWGGRSSFGYDCSGFVQMLYAQLGVYLPRDSKQQVGDSRFKTVALADMEPGDLIFFGKAEDKISHVGMYIGEGKFIHASPRENQPWIRISSLSDREWSGQTEVSLPYRTFRQLK